MPLRTETLAEAVCGGLQGIVEAQERNSSLRDVGSRTANAISGSEVYFSGAPLNGSGTIQTSHEPAAAHSTVAPLRPWSVA